MPADHDEPARLAIQHSQAHGHAALLLVESLVHGLLARSIITLDEAIDIVETADSVQLDLADASRESAPAMWEAHALLAAIGNSLRIDGGGTASDPDHH